MGSAHEKLYFLEYPKKGMGSVELNIKI